MPDCFTFIWKMCFRFDPDLTYLWHLFGAMVMVFSYRYLFRRETNRVQLKISFWMAIVFYTATELRDMTSSFFDLGD